MTRHELLAQKAAQAIEELFSDSSVPPDITKADMQALIESIKIRIEALEYQMEYTYVS
jgi:hypothetical protein